MEIKRYHPRLNRLYQVLICGHIPFFIVYSSIIWKDPYYTGFDNLTNLPIYIAGSLNFAAIIYMFIRRRSIQTTIVFIGSVLLVIGCLCGIALVDKSIIMYVVIIETLLFMGVISYLDMKNFKKAVESDKLKQINDFKNVIFTNISHEFRTPLMLISTPIARKLEDKTLSKKDRYNFEMMQHNNKRLLGLVDQLMDLSKVETRSLRLRVSRGNVLNLIAVLVESFIYMADQKKLACQKKINNDTVEVWFDRDIIEKIIVNLLSNAIKYTPEGGSVICSAFTEAGILTVEVKNTGKGISKEQSEKVFERFYQADETEQGIGIGLALVKELVTLHKGSIGVESKPDDWTTFKVCLPVAKKAFNDSEIGEIVVEQKPDPVIIAKVMTIPETPQNPEDEFPILLIVEDGNDPRILLKNIFENEYRVIMAKNGKEGTELALKHIPALIISDIIMPVKDGIALTKDLKNDERTSHIPIILLTAKVGEEHELTGIETGADDYITKPFNSRILISKVGKLIELRQKLRDKYSQELVLKPKEIIITPVDEQFLVKVQAMLDQKLIEPSFSVEEFSQLIGMSRMQLHRKLKALTGLSPSNFLRSQRLKLTAQLLKDPKIRISEVGYSVGFNNMSYFSKCFKEMFHCTPSEYAKK